MRQIYMQAQPLEGEALKRIVYPEGEDVRILQTAQEVVNLGIGKPVLLGRPEVVEPLIRELGLTFTLGGDVELINPQDDARLPDYAEDYYTIRKRDGVSRAEALVHLRSRWLTWACLMVRRGEADAVVCGVSGRFMRFLQVAAHIVNGDPGTEHIYALNLVMSPSTGPNVSSGGGQLLALCDTHVQPDPSAEQIA
jgi:malate dehydrogenase (oxaloacetate-decarboxylating)(NADP+)